MACPWQMGCWTALLGLLSACGGGVIEGSLDEDDDGDLARAPYDYAYVPMPTNKDIPQ